MPLAEFVERTSFLRLDEWQVNLCERLEEIAAGKGRRVAIHAPPQFGKSIIVSQRFPAWLLARDPLHRIKLACYNVTHSTRFARIVRDVMQSAEYREMFPDVGLRVPGITSAEEWSTRARAQLRDAQPSFKALGLATGFVGQGADTLLIDDPYSSPEEAYSEIINNKVYGFWTDTAKPRLTEEANVILMFHRYTENDLAGRVLEEGDWDLLRYAAIADGDYSHPVSDSRWGDPMGRPEGVPLSPRFSSEYYQRQASNSYVWLSQFQGRPTAKTGAFFKVNNLEVIPAGPADLLLKVRAWDLAATENGGNFTVGVLMGVDWRGIYYVLNVRRGQWGSDDRDKMMRQTAVLDGKDVSIRFPQDPGAAGKTQALAITRLLSGYSVEGKSVSGAKTVRADPFASQVNVGNVKLVVGDWNKAFIEELRQFPLGKFDDQVDAAADAFAELAERFGESNESLTGGDRSQRVPGFDVY